ncbi:hypothetical protein ACFHWT_21810, partial [Micromonospora sp. LOL_021]
MTTVPQRRTPSGQGPARRPGQPGRSGSRGPLRLAGRDTGPDSGSRADQRGRPTRSAGADRPAAPRSGTPRSAAGDHVAMSFTSCGNCPLCLT